MLYAILGLIFGAIISLITLASGLDARAEEAGAGAVGAIFGAWAVIILPVLYGCLGFVMTALLAALYNVTARVVGGVQIDVS